MPPSEQFPKRDIHLDCGQFFLRTLGPEDASERWGAWMADPKNVRLLNAPAKAMTREEVATYVRQFDQKTHLLIGIFEKSDGQLIGFFRLDIDPALKRCLMFLMIGEQRYRNWRTTNDLRGPFQDFIFENLGLNPILATVLTSNQAMIRYMLKSGWRLDKAAAQNIKSHTGGAMLDLSYLSITRDSWQAWKKKNLPQR
ncbi:MAG TPA: GNAT family protein [Pseudolabrys sp.]